MSFLYATRLAMLQVSNNLSLIITLRSKPITSLASTPLVNPWIINSADTHHIATEPHNLQSYHNNKDVYVGDGNKSMPHVGSTQLQASNHIFISVFSFSLSFDESEKRRHHWHVARTKVDCMSGPFHLHKLTCKLINIHFKN